MPGVPDFYQGTEFWDFSLVDPDNRRPVDFAARARRAGVAGSSRTGIGLAQNWPQRPSEAGLDAASAEAAHRTRRCVRGRRLPAAGSERTASRPFIAFARRRGRDAAIVVVTRWFAPFTDGGRHWPRPESYYGVEPRRPEDREEEQRAAQDQREGQPQRIAHAPVMVLVLEHGAQLAVVSTAASRARRRPAAAGSRRRRPPDGDRPRRGPRDRRQLPRAQGAGARTGGRRAAGATPPRPRSGARTRRAARGSAPRPRRVEGGIGDGHAGDGEAMGPGGPAVHGLRGRGDRRAIATRPQPPIRSCSRKTPRGGRSALAGESLEGTAAFGVEVGHLAGEVTEARRRRTARRARRPRPGRAGRRTGRA